MQKSGKPNKNLIMLSSSLVHESHIKTHHFLLHWSIKWYEKRSAYNGVVRQAWISNDKVLFNTFKCGSKIKTLSLFSSSSPPLMPPLKLQIPLPFYPKLQGEAIFGVLEHTSTLWGFKFQVRVDFFSLEIRGCWVFGSYDG